MTQIPWMIATAMVIVCMMLYTVISLKIKGLITGCKPLTLSYNNTHGLTYNKGYDTRHKSNR